MILISEEMEKTFVIFLGNPQLRETRKINHAIRIDYETLFNYSFLFNRRTVHFLKKITKIQFQYISLIDRNVSVFV